MFVALALSGHAVHAYDSPSVDDKRGQGQGHNSVCAPAIHGLYDLYEVSGSCEHDLENDLAKKAGHWTDGNKYDSVTRWWIRWDYGYDRSGGVCSAEGFKFTVDVVVTIPAWLHRDAASPQLIEKWDTYIEKLREHENEHLEKVVQAVDELTRAVEEMPAAASCADLDRQISLLSRNRLKHLEQEQNIYDAETAHGWTQGALFP